MSTLFSCCVHRENVARFRSKVSGRGSRERRPSEAETLFSFWTCNGSYKFACFSIFYGSYGQGKSGKVRECKSTRVQKLTKMQKKIC